MIQNKIKVDTKLLLKAVKERRNKMISDHEIAIHKYQKELESYADSVEKAVQKVALQISKGNLPEFEDSYRKRGIVIPIGKEYPSEPQLNLSQIDRLIKTLELAAEDSITISADDARLYLG